MPDDDCLGTISSKRFILAHSFCQRNEIKQTIDLQLSFHAKLD